MAQTSLTGAAQGVGYAAKNTNSLSPQLLLLPLPFDPAASAFPETADVGHPLTHWMRARGTPIGYMTVPVPEPVQQALRVLPTATTRVLLRD